MSRDNRWGGNKFSAGPLRLKLYELGAGEALLLDSILPTWKETMFDDKVYLSDLLKQSAAPSLEERAEYLNLARTEYNYDEVYKNKIGFEQEGNRVKQENLAAIRDTKNTLITIYYGEVAQRLKIGYTPFGVTQILD
jgi:hypothetical protein